VPRASITVGQRTFCHSSPVIWHTIPLSVRVQRRFAHQYIQAPPKIILLHFFLTSASEWQRLPAPLIQAVFDCAVRKNFVSVVRLRSH